MFDKQNKSFGQITNQKKTVNIDEIPIRTMEKDMKNPQAAETFFENEPSPAKQGSEMMQKTPRLSEKEKTSPFLRQQSGPSGQRPPENPQRENIQVQSAPIDIDRPEKLGESHLNFGKMSLIALLVFVLILASVSGYYFFMTRNTTEDISGNEDVVATDEPATEEETTEEEISQGQINLDKPNYLIVNSTSPSVAGTQLALKNKFDEVSALSPENPVEFIPTDEDFSPLSFSEVGKKLSLELPQGLADGQLLEPIIYIDTNGMALVAKSSDTASLRTVLRNNESRLLKGMESFFWNSNVDTYAGKIFDSAGFQGADIRYLNISDDGRIALDYAFLEDYLIIANSKETAFSVITALSEGATTESE